MVSATPCSNSNPNPKNRKHVHHIGGIQVEFPYQPYGSQLAFMCRVISTLDRAQRDGHFHALLESPTGTGKSLSLLCSTLAWQQNYKIRNQSANLSQSKAAPEAMTDPLACGGGFIPETQPSNTPVTGNPEPGQSPANKNQKKKMAPTIYYASRTHSQISQVIREYRKTAYRVPMAVLASRKHYCTNPRVRGRENMDEECKLLLRDRGGGCCEFKNVHRVKYHPSFQKGGSHEVHDIEDLVKVGQVVRGCSYYAARSMADDAQLILCPYNYVINPVIRGAMDVDIKEAIVIFDEAHNIEDVARDAGSLDLEEDILLKLQTELEQLCLVDAIIYQPLYEMIQDLISWIEHRKSTLEKREFQHYISCWTGEKALVELQEANISLGCFPILLECATKAIKAASDTESEAPHLSGMSVMTLEELFSSLTYFFSRNGSHIHDYQLVLQRYVKRDAKNAFGGWTISLSLWCLNPAVVFRDIADLSLSVILTSGTLSPVNSFSSELGVQFGTSLEAPHVIDVESQVWAAVISAGPDNYPLNASYKMADSYAFQDAVGKSLEEIFKIVPGGSLVFFPSYKLMEKLSSRWRETGQWSRLNLRKSLFVEPKGGSQEEFEQILKDYYNSISRGSRPAAGGKRRVKKTDIDTVELQGNLKEGAAFLAVCRGKVSEGIDFADDNARVVVSFQLSLFSYLSEELPGRLSNRNPVGQEVEWLATAFQDLIVVGIPFPNINDIQVGLKKKYNDTYKSSKNLLSGSEWYCHQAFRTLNQAIGRCIRHRFDYGAIILLDERYREERNTAYISKWLRKSIRQYDHFNTSLGGLESFFKDAKDRVGKAIADSGNYTISEEDTLSVDQNKEFTSRKHEKTIKSDHPGLKVGKNMIHLQNFKTVEGDIPSMYRRKGLIEQKNQKLDKSNSVQSKVCAEKFDGTAPWLKSKGCAKFQGSLQTDHDTKSCKEYIDLECHFQKDSRCLELLSETFSPEDPEISIVRETPGMNGTNFTASPYSFSKDGNSTSTIIDASVESSDQFMPHLGSLLKLGEDPSKAESSMIVTPEKGVTACGRLLIPEMESSVNLSVNSHATKRRKSVGSSLIDLVQEESSDTSNAKASGCMSFTRRIEFGSQTSCPGQDSKSIVCQLLAENKNDASSYSVNDRKLQISCSLCRSPLGLPENNLYVNCLFASSSKAHLLSLLKDRLESGVRPTTISVIMTDISSVHQRLCNRALEGAVGQGIWCEQDGCVFSNIFCPFCSIPNNCLGAQIMATDSSNVQLLNKVLFFLDHIEIRNSDEIEDKESDKAPKEKDLKVNATPVDKTSTIKAIDNFSYSAKQKDLGGWRTTKSKLRLPKRGLRISEEE